MPLQSRRKAPKQLRNVLLTAFPDLYPVVVGIAVVVCCTIAPLFGAGTLAGVDL